MGRPSIVRTGMHAPSTTAMRHLVGVHLGRLPARMDSLALWTAHAIRPRDARIHLWSVMTEIHAPSTAVTSKLENVCSQTAQLPFPVTTAMHAPTTMRAHLVKVPAWEKPKTAMIPTPARTTFVMQLLGVAVQPH